MAHNAFIGTFTNSPIYGDPIITIIDENNINNYFDITYRNGFNWCDSKDLNQADGVSRYGLGSNNSSNSEKEASIILVPKRNGSLRYSMKKFTNSAYASHFSVYKDPYIQGNIWKQKYTGTADSKNFITSLKTGVPVKLTYKSPNWGACIVYNIQLEEEQILDFSLSATTTSKIIKNCYIGIKNVSKKIKKIYIGNLNNMSSLCWQKSLEFFKALKTNKSSGVCASTNKYWFICGGTQSNIAYDINLTCNELADPPLDINGLTRCANQENVYFAGGTSWTSHYSSSKINISYDNNLTQTRLPDLQTARSKIGATAINNIIFFAGGVYYSDNGNNTYDVEASSVIDVYDKSTKLNSLYLNNNLYSIAATTLNNYAIFAGGIIGGWHTEGERRDVKKVTAYDQYLTKYDTISDLSQTRGDIGAATINNYSIFAGGSTKVYTAFLGTATTTVDAYNSSFTHFILDNLTYVNSSGTKSAATVEPYAVFAGGGADSDEIEIYDEFLNHSLCDDKLCTNFSSPSVASLKNYILFFNSGSGIADIHKF